MRWLILQSWTMPSASEASRGYRAQRLYRGPSSLSRRNMLGSGRPGRFGFVPAAMAALSLREFHVVVTECGDGIWEWEICRQGEPLPARMRDGPFKSHDIALGAGNVALREFLDLIEFAEQESF